MAALSPQAYEEFVRKHQTWNFWVCLAEPAFSQLAFSFVFGSTVLSLYASHLVHSTVLIGLIPTIQSMGFLVPQLLLARQIEGLERKKPWAVRISVAERLPHLITALSILLWPGAPAPVAYAILALDLMIGHGAAGLGAPAWISMINKVVPVRRRGMLFGLSQAIGGLLGIAGAALSSRVMATQPYPASFGYCFLLSFGAHALAWTALNLTREPPLAPTKTPVGAGVYFQRLPEVLRRHPNYRRYLTSRALIVFGSMATAFYVIYGRRTLGISDAFAASLTVAALASQAVTPPLLGWLADRRGNKWLTEAATLLSAGAVVVTLLAPNPYWLFLTFFLMNAGKAGMSVASLSVTMEFSDPDDVPTYTALTNTLMGIPSFVAPLLGGWLADAAGFRALFVAALALGLSGWAGMRFGVREPREERRAAVAGRGGEA